MTTHSIKAVLISLIQRYSFFLFYSLKHMTKRKKQFRIVLVLLYVMPLTCNVDTQLTHTFFLFLRKVITMITC